MKKMHAYFCTHKNATLLGMWGFFTIALGYMLICMFLMPTWNFWLWLFPGVCALYFRLTYNKAAYNPEKDKASDQYVPYKQRKKKKHKR